MLSINNNVILHSNHREHAWALRTIGQDLADLRPDYLEIEFTGQVYIARGRAQSKQIGVNKGGASGIFGTFKRPRKDGAGQRENGWFERRYTLYDINRLDDQRLIERKNCPTAPDIYGLGERLRTMGKMVEAKGGQLLKLTLDNQRVSFTYRDATGTEYHEEHSTPALYRSQQDGNQLRGSGRTRDPWAIYAPRGGGREVGMQRKLRLMPDSTVRGTIGRKEDDEG